jgi:hypothetical protein
MKSRKEWICQLDTLISNFLKVMLLLMNSCEGQHRLRISHCRIYALLLLLLARTQCFSTWFSGLIIPAAIMNQDG